MTPLILYRQQAAKEQDAADAAVLENVRDRSRRAAEAWTKLASQIEHADELRAKRQATVDAGKLANGDPNHEQAIGSPDGNTSAPAATGERGVGQGEGPEEEQPGQARAGQAARRKLSQADHQQPVARKIV